eukprot:1778638-Pyramimonas_sp.AAC.1
MMEYRARLWDGFWSVSEEEILRLGDAMSDLRAVAMEHVKDLLPSPPHAFKRVIFLGDNSCRSSWVGASG